MLGHYEKYIYKFPSHLRALLPNIEVFSAKNGKKSNFWFAFGCTERRKKISGILGLEYPQRAKLLPLNVTPIGSSWWRGRKPPESPFPLATPMTLYKRNKTAIMNYLGGILSRLGDDVLDMSIISMFFGT